MKVFYNRRRSLSFNHLANFWHRRVGRVREQVSHGLERARADGRSEPFLQFFSFVYFPPFFLVRALARVNGSEDADDA